MDGKSDGFKLTLKVKPLNLDSTNGLGGSANNLANLQNASDTTAKVSAVERQDSLPPNWASMSRMRQQAYLLRQQSGSAYDSSSGRGKSESSSPEQVRAIGTGAGQSNLLMSASATVTIEPVKTSMQIKTERYCELLGREFSEDESKEWDDLLEEIKKSKDPESFRPMMKALEAVVDKLEETAVSEHLYKVIEPALVFFAKTRDYFVKEDGLSLASKVCNKIEGQVRAEDVPSQNRARLVRLVDEMKVSNGVSVADSEKAWNAARVYPVSLEEPEVHASEVGESKVWEPSFDFSDRSVGRLNEFFPKGAELVVGLDLDETTWYKKNQSGKSTVHYRPYFKAFIGYLQKLKDLNVNVKVVVWSQGRREHSERYYDKELKDLLDGDFYRDELNREYPDLKLAPFTDGCLIKDLHEIRRRRDTAGKEFLMGEDAKVLFVDDDATNFIHVLPVVNFQVKKFNEKSKWGDKEFLRVLSYLDKLLEKIAEDPQGAVNKVECIKEHTDITKNDYPTWWDLILDQ